MPLLLFDMPVDSPGCTNLFFKVELCALYIWLYFSKPILFFVVVVFLCFYFTCSGQSRMHQLFFIYMIFFSFSTGFFFFKVIGFLLLLTGFFQSHEVIKDGTFTFLRSGCNRLIRMDSIKREVHNCILYSD